MCAAPGSKTAQLIEMIHADEGNILPGNNLNSNYFNNYKFR